MAFLEERITDNIFFEIKKESQQDDLDSIKNIEIILHFLGKILENSLVLYETKFKFSAQDMGKSESRIIEELQKLLDTANLNIKLIKGKIREIYISYS